MSIPAGQPFHHLSSSDRFALQKIGKVMDGLGQFPTAAFRIIAQNRHFQMFVPEERGGLALDLVTAAEIIEEYGWIEGNLGWIVQIGAGGGVFAAYLPEQIAMEYFSKPDQVIAGSDFVGGTAIPVENGYRVSGHWKYASGSWHASAFTGNVRITEGPRAGDVYAFIVPSPQVQINPTWNAMGMRATDSHEFSLEEIVVPGEQMFALTPDHLQVEPTPLFRIPFLVFARAVFVPVLSGVALKYSELYQDMLHRKKIGTGTLAYQAVEQLRQVLHDDRKSFFDQTKSIWNFAGKGVVPKEEADRFADFCIQMTTTCLKVVAECHRYSGMEGIRMDTPINVAYRNIVTAGAHYLLSPDSL